MRYITHTPKKLKDAHKGYCGPIAMINTLKHLGKKCTLKDLSLIAKKLNCNEQGATTPCDICKYLQKMKIKYSYQKIKDIVVLVKKLKRYKCVVVCVVNKNKTSGHCFFAKLWGENGIEGMSAFDSTEDYYDDKYTFYHSTECFFIK